MNMMLMKKVQIISQLYELIGEKSILRKLNAAITDDEKIKQLHENIQKGTIQIESAFLKKIIIDVIENNILFIQLAQLGRILQQENGKLARVEEDWNKCQDYDILIMKYIEKRLDNFKYSKVAYLILFLLCQDTKGIYANTTDDFKNITMESQEVINATIEYIKKLQLVVAVKSHDNIRASDVAQYEISHDYIREVVFNVCNSKLDASVQNNIIFYNREYQVERSEYSSINQPKKIKEVSNRLNKYMEDKGGWLYAMLVLMFVVVAGTNIYYLNIYSQSDYYSNCVRIFLTNITTTASMYYIFNYYYYFMRIFGHKYWIGVIMAMLAVVISYLCEDYWAIGYGIEIFLVGIIMFRISKRVRTEEENFFKDRCRNFCVIGIIVILLGGFYSLYSQNDMGLAWPFYMLYVVYMFLGSISHINKKYIFSLLGKVLY